MAGYAMAPDAFHLSTFLLCTLGTGLQSASANAINQVRPNFRVEILSFDTVLQPITFLYLSSYNKQKIVIPAKVRFPSLSKR